MGLLIPFGLALLGGIGYVSWTIHKKVMAGVMAGPPPRTGLAANDDIEMGGGKKKPGELVGSRIKYALSRRIGIIL